MGKSTINGGANGKMIYFHGDSTTIFWFYDILILKFGKLINWDGTSPTVGRIMDSTNPQPQLSSGSPAWGAWISMKHQLISHIYKSGVYIYMIIYIYTIYHISYIIYHIYIYNISYIIYHIYISYIQLNPIDVGPFWPRFRQGPDNFHSVTKGWEEERSPCLAGGLMQLMMPSLGKRNV